MAIKRLAQAVAAESFHADQLDCTKRPYHRKRQVFYPQNQSKCFRLVSLLFLHFHSFFKSDGTLITSALITIKKKYYYVSYIRNHHIFTQSYTIHSMNKIYLLVNLQFKLFIGSTGAQKKHTI